MHESVHREGKFHNKKFALGILRGLAVHCLGTGSGGLEILPLSAGVIIDGNKGESQAKQRRTDSNRRSETSSTKSQVLESRLP